jgi:hypothetical protein
MKMTVITDKKGAVVATYRHEEEYKTGQARFRLNALAGQSIHEIDMPAELEKNNFCKGASFPSQGAPQEAPQEEEEIEALMPAK